MIFSPSLTRVIHLWRYVHDWTRRNGVLGRHLIVSCRSVVNILLSCRLRCAESHLKPRAVLSLVNLTKFLLPSYLTQGPVWEDPNRQVSVNKLRCTTARSTSTPTQAAFYFPTFWGAMNRPINLLGHCNVQGHRKRWTGFETAIT